MKRFETMDNKAGKISAKDGVKLLIMDISNPENQSIYDFKNITELNKYIKDCGGRSCFKGFFLGIYTKDDKFYYKNSEWIGM